MPKQKLFDDESEEEVEIKTENEYAKKYDQWRGKEEMHKLEQKYGSKALDSDASLSSDSEDESDEAPEVAEETETQFLKTLALLKKKDPRIYDPGYKFFDEPEKETVKTSKEKTLTFADSDEDDDDDDGNIFSIEKKADVADEVKQTNSQIGKHGKVKDFLTGKVDHLEATVEQDLAPLKALWSDPTLNEGEAFLRDYILNQKYLEAGADGSATDRLRDDDELGADEAMVEEQDKFERAYNFRFEEPDQEYLKRYPRTMSYIRPKDERRATRRAELRTRKDEARARKMDEIARLKALKLQEIQQKIARIKEVTGNEELAFKDSDIEGDFDPAAHDRRMRAIFDDQYYGEADEEKPVFPDLDKELEIENWEEFEPGHEEKEAQDFSLTEPHCEDAEFNMDADFEPNSGRANLLEEMKRALGKKRRNRRNKSRLAALLAQDKPKYIPEEEDTYDQYMEEYYKMDCEDIIGGDLPTRFKYREVVPNDYGLTIEEILLADDKELTQWAPLKKLVRLQPESAQRSEVHAYSQKAADKHLKKKVLPSLFKNLPEEPELVISKEENKKKKKNRRKKNKQKATEDVEEKGELNETLNVENTSEEIENTEEVEEVKNVPVSEKVAKKKAKRKNTEVSQPSVNELNDNVEGILGNREAPKKMVKTKEDNLQTTEHIKKKNINIQPTIKKDDTKNESKTDSSIKDNKLSKRQKKNLKKKQKKIEKVKYASLNSKGQNNVAVKKRKISANEQVSSKKHRPTNNDAELKINKPSHRVKQNKSTTEERNGKNDPTDIEKPGNKDKTKNRDLKKNKDKFKNKNKQKTDLKKKVKQIINKNNNNDKTENPMNNLSDERLKAYGLNPKKYRGFLKYKKF